METISSKTNRRIIFLLYLFFVLSGMTGLVYEILWSRKLSIIFGHTVFAISSILSAFMGGLALGSYILGKFTDKIPASLKQGQKGNILTFHSYSPYFRLYGICELIIGIYAFLTPVLIEQIGNLYVVMMKSFPIPMYPLSLITFFMSVIIILVPTICMGATLPVVTKFVVKTYEEIMEKTARIYALNTFGAVIGSFLAGFILFPTIGLQNTLNIAAVTNTVIGIAVLLVDYFLAKGSEYGIASISEMESSAGKMARPADQDIPIGNENVPSAINSSCPNSAGETKEKPLAGYAEPIQSSNLEPLYANSQFTTSNLQQPTFKIHRIILIVFFISGFTSMLYEVCWTRALALSIGSSVYSFSSILTTFLFGIALGSYIFSNTKIFRPEKISANTLANTELLIGITSFVILPILGVLPYIFLRLFPYLKESYALVVAGNFLVSFLVILVPTILFGMTFPMVVKIYATDLESLGRSIGSVYASNTVGNILGSFLTGFFLIPLLGAEISLKIGIAMNLMAAAIIYLLIREKKTKQLFYALKLGVIVGIIIVLFSVNFWRASAMTMGAAIYVKDYSEIKSYKAFLGTIDNISKQIVFYKDGISSTVTVRKLGKYIALMVNGKADASYSPDGSLDMSTQWLLGFLPPALHPDPKRVCVIGFGSGITTAAASQNNKVLHVDCVEIEPAVLEAAKIFSEGNLDIINNSKCKFHIADGRNFILAAKEKYDVIVSEPSNPWIAGIGNLFSKDFYEAASLNLNDDGIYCQWIHTYSMSASTIKMILKTFYNVFPHGSVWLISDADLMLVGSKKKLAIDYQNLKFAAENPYMAKYLKLLKYSRPAQLTAFYVTDVDSARMYSMEGQINSDNMPLLEFAAPFHLYEHHDRTLIMDQLFQYHPKDYNHFTNLDKSLLGDAIFHYNNGLVYQALYRKEEALQSFSKCLEVDPSFYPAYLSISKLLENNGNDIKALEFLEKAIAKYPSEPSAYIEVIELLRKSDSSEPALAACKRALSIIPDNPQLKEQYVMIQMGRKNYRDALTVANELANKYPDVTQYQYHRGKIYYEMGNLKEAQNVYNRILMKDPADSTALEGIGDIFSQLAKFESAIESYDKALRVDDSPRIRLKLAQACQKIGDKERARFLYLQVLGKDKENVEARRGLYELGVAN